MKILFHIISTILAVSIASMFLGWFFETWFRVQEIVENRFGEAFGSAVWMLVVPILFIVVASTALIIGLIWHF